MGDTEKDLERSIVQQVQWSQLPLSVKEFLGHSQDSWKRRVVAYSLQYELPWGSSLIRHIVMDEKRYYEEIVRVGLKNLQLYPHHLSRYLITVLHYSPFKYYHEMLHTMMKDEKSYDTLPNFTAIDVLRLVGVGRNEYIDMMNKCRVQNWLPWRKKKHPILSLLPNEPKAELQYWWRVHVTILTIDEMTSCTPDEQKIVEMATKLAVIGSSGSGSSSGSISGSGSGEKKLAHLRCGSVERGALHSLYKKGLLYCSVPIKNDDIISVPTLEGFVMNTTTNNVFEELLYTILFVIDSRTTPAQLASLLRIDLSLVKRAISIYCRLGLAKRMLLKGLVDADKKPTSPQWHPSWIEYALSRTEEESSIMSKLPLQSGTKVRVAFVFDSRLTAFLMMGNLTPGLKSYAVTLFEQGKMCDNQLPSFLSELDRVGTGGEESLEQEGEAQTYFDHAVNLRETLRFLRGGTDDKNPEREIEMVRIESMSHLSAEPLRRLLKKNYGMMISLSPLTPIGPASIFSHYLPHFGPVLPEINSPWFPLFLYSLLGKGPPSLLLPRGVRLSRIPPLFRGCGFVVMSCWSGEPVVVSLGLLLGTVNDALRSSPVLLQAESYTGKTAEFTYVPIPLSKKEEIEYQTALLISTSPPNPVPSLLSPSPSISLSPSPSPSLSPSPSPSVSPSPSPSLSPSPSPSPSELSVETTRTRTPSPFSNPSSKLLEMQKQVSQKEGDYERLSNLPIITQLAEKIPLLHHTAGYIKLIRYSPNEEWIIGGVNFGIPLFDRDLNFSIGHRLHSQGLFEGTNLRNQQEHAVTLASQVSEFIEKLHGKQVERFSESVEKQSICYPVHVHCFDDGKLLSLNASDLEF